MLNTMTQRQLQWGTRSASVCLAFFLSVFLLMHAPWAAMAHVHLLLPRSACTRCGVTGDTLRPVWQLFLIWRRLLGVLRLAFGTLFVAILSEQT
jgi:hypothetical protein